MLYSMQCCGVKEIAGISNYTPRQVITQIMSHAYYKRAGLYIFTGVVHGESDSYGGRFAEYIRVRKLGTVTASEASRNPNTMNTVKVWVWKPNYIALAKLAEDKKTD